MHYGRPYNYEFYIPRDEIENVIKQLGMDIIPPENLYKRYSEQNISYLQYLIETRRYHAYKPTRTNDVLETLKESLTSCSQRNGNTTLRFLSSQRLAFH